MNTTRTVNDLAQDIGNRKYPDVTAVALCGLLMTERLRSKPGYETARHWGHGPADVELRRLGLVTIGSPAYVGGTHPVDLTDTGRAVAEILAAKRTAR